ncbi:MAG: hypothetical protein K2G47_08455 [Muribaculum sp.]|nr:hypothetical protein [Muribaculum sp.]
MIRLLRYIVLCVLSAMAMTGCIEDGFTTSPSDQPVYSVDTLKIGTVFTAEGTPTRSFKVYNRHDKGLSISKISFRDPAMESIFRLNVDGVSGTSFDNVEIRANDSIFVLVEATLPESGTDLPVEINAGLDFVTNGVTSTVVLNAFGQDVTRLEAFTVAADMSLSGDKPYQIYDSLVVAEGATLTLDAGTTLYFHDKAELVVHGTLISNGTADRKVNMTGDRFGQVVGRIPYEIMSGQWGGVYFYGSTTNNRLSHTSIRNSVYGVYIDSVSVDAVNPVLTLVNCQLRNSAGAVLVANYAPVTAVGCEFAEAARGVVYVNEGTHRFNHCTFSNNYLFSAISGPMLYLDGENVSADISNSILYGMGGEVLPSDLVEKPVYFRNCLFAAAGTDDDNFINTIWDADPLFYTVREDYYFDYRLREGSPAIGRGDPSLTMPEASVDMQGMARGNTPDVGAYVFSRE